MNYMDIFNDRTCNIFCDGSITTNNNTKETIGCSGCAIVLNNDNIEYLIDTPRNIVRNATNNITENRAIMLSILNAIKYRNLGYNINIFSDSQYCIYGLTNWIFSWVKNTYNKIMYNSSGEQVKNQELIKEIIITIYNSNLDLNFYHQKGHVTTTKQSITKAINCFSKSNGINNLDPYLIERISFYNDMVDKFTKLELDEFSKTEEFNNLYPQLIYPVTWDLNYVDMNIYSNLIKRRIRYV